MKLIPLLFLTAVSSYIIPDEGTLELKKSVYSKLAMNLPSVQIAYLGEDFGIGLIATQDIKRGHIIGATPAIFLLTSFDDYPFKSYLKKGPQALSLLGRFVYEKFINNSRDYINTYVKTLPSEINNVFNWTAEEYRYLSSSIHGGLSLKSPLDYEKGWEIYYEGISRYPGITSLCPACLEKDVYTWAYTIVFSRAYDIVKYVWKQLRGLPVAAGDDIIYGAVFIPMLDLINHSPIPVKYKKDPKDVGLKFQVSGSPGAVLVAEGDFPAGSEITFAYGEKRNLELYIPYGFFIKNNLDEYTTAAMGRVENCLETLLKESNACLFKLRVYEINQNLLYMIRKFYSSSEVPLLSSDSETLSYYDSLDGSGETKSNFITSILQYHSSIFKNIESSCAFPFREVSRRLQSTYTNKRMRDVDEMCYESHMAFFKHIRRSDRLLYRELGLLK
jgi:hypothetical protein